MNSDWTQTEVAEPAPECILETTCVDSQLQRTSEGALKAAFWKWQLLFAREEAGGRASRVLARRLCQRMLSLVTGRSQRGSAFLSL